MSPDYKNFTVVKFNPLTYLHIYHSVVSNQGLMNHKWSKLLECNQRHCPSTHRRDSHTYTNWSIWKDYITACFFVTISSI